MLKKNNITDAIASNSSDSKDKIATYFLDNFKQIGPLWVASAQRNSVCAISRQIKGSKLTILFDIGWIQMVGDSNKMKHLQRRKL